MLGVGVPGKCWPMGHGQPWWPHDCDNETKTCSPSANGSFSGHAQCEAACLANPSCNAINIDTAGGGCILRACPMAKLEARTS